MQNNFMGKNGFVWWQGVVEDRHDPLYLGRCRVRILGWHTSNRVEMPTESLPWSYPIQPITSAAQTGVGTSPTGPVEGTWVVGFFRDGEYGQEPVFFGTLGGIPDTPASNIQGFSDPRVDTNDDEHPFVQLNKKLLTYVGVDEEARVPRAPRSITYYSPNTFTDDTINQNQVDTSKQRTVPQNTPTVQVIIDEYPVRSKYPDVSYLNEPTTPRAARGVYGKHPDGNDLIIQKINWRNFTSPPNGYPVAEEGGARWSEPKPDEIYKARYPYNHVHQSESGHLIEIDDTPGSERLHRYHRAGTYEEIGSLGQRITKIANEDFKISLMSDYERVRGSKYESIGGKKDINITGGLFLSSGLFNAKVGGDVAFNTPTKFSVTSGSMVFDASGGSIVMRAKSISLDRLTSENTDNTRGNSTVKVGGKYALRAGSLQMASRGSSGITSGGSLTMSIAENIQESVTNILGGALGTPARKFNAAFGDISFETALLGGVNLNVGPAGLFASIEMSKIGEITIKGGFGLSTITLGATGITLSYGGLSTLELGPAGATLSGLTSEVTGSVQSKVTGALVNVEASGINTISGALVKIN